MLISNASMKLMTLMYQWDLGSFLENAKKLAEKWGGSFLMLIGAVAVIYGGYQVVTGLMSHGKKQIAWPTVILTILVGGAFMFSGFNLVRDISSVGNDTIKSLGENGADKATGQAPSVIVISPDGHPLN